MPYSDPKERRAYERRNRAKLADQLKCRTYGLSQEQLDVLRIAQNNRCAICQHKLQARRSEGPYVEHVDHDHKTGRVRALLCGKCNRGIGCFDENPDLLRDAIDYLEATRAV